MADTLSRGATVLTLPKNLTWPDEYEWAQVEQRTQYSITGALIIEAGAKQAGRPITLQGDRSGPWFTRATLETLRAWAALPAEQFVLSYRGTNLNVVFDHSQNAITAQSIAGHADPEDSDFYAATLRFLEV